jgi:hypothetical protein
MRKILSIFLMVMAFAPAFAEKQKPFNRIVVTIDASSSFKGHQYEAIEKVRGFLKK